jgi:metal-sulfur cluster biosynthetic enzyme
MTPLTSQTIVDAVNTVEHPEIAMSLVDLGMVRDIVYDPERNAAAATLVIPFMGIPEVVRHYMLNALYVAIEKTGVDTVEFDIAEMTNDEREEFFAKEHAYWKA